VYANASKDRAAFDGKLEFEVTLIAYEGSTDWVEPTLFSLKACLDSDLLPAAHADCDYCRYREAAGRALLPYMPSPLKPSPIPPPSTPIKSKKLAKSDEEETTGQLF
jgi:hypothetical protein